MKNAFCAEIINFHAESTYFLSCVHHHMNYETFLYYISTYVCIYVNKLFIKKYTPKGNGFSMKCKTRWNYYFLTEIQM